MTPAAQAVESGSLATGLCPRLQDGACCAGFYGHVQVEESFDFLGGGWIPACAGMTGTFLYAVIAQIRKTLDD